VAQFVGQVQLALKRAWWMMRAPSMSEAVYYARVQPATACRFHVISSQRNASSGALRCLESLYNQRYDRSRVTHVFTDDASDDDTPELVKRWLLEHPGHFVRFIRNRERRGPAFNSLRAIKMAPPGSIVVEVDGDDWLPDRGVLQFLNKVYGDPGVWMTYNTAMKYKNGHYRRPSRKWRPIPRAVLAEGAIRRYELDSLGHLRTFRAELAWHVRLANVIDPATGDLFITARDKAFYFSLIELAGTHARHIHRITYVYDISRRWAVPREESAQRTERVRSLPPHQPLGDLAADPPRDSALLNLELELDPPTETQRH